MGHVSKLSVGTFYNNLQVFMEKGELESLMKSLGMRQIIFFLLNIFNNKIVSRSPQKVEQLNSEFSLPFNRRYDFNLW